MSLSKEAKDYAVVLSEDLREDLIDVLSKHWNSRPKDFRDTFFDVSFIVLKQVTNEVLAWKVSGEEVEEK